MSRSTGTHKRKGGVNVEREGREETKRRSERGCMYTRRGVARDVRERHLRSKSLKLEYPAAAVLSLERQGREGCGGENRAERKRGRVFSKTSCGWEEHPGPKGPSSCIVHHHQTVPSTWPVSLALALALADSVCHPFPDDLPLHTDTDSPVACRRLWRGVSLSALPASESRVHGPETDRLSRQRIRRQMYSRLEFTGRSGSRLPPFRSYLLHRLHSRSPIPSPSSVQLHSLLLYLFRFAGNCQRYHQVQLHPAVVPSRHICVQLLLRYGRITEHQHLSPISNAKE